MLIKQKIEMTERERLAAENSNNQFLQALAYVAVGTIFPYAGENAPDTFMLCDGTSLDVTEYAELFAVIGYTFGGSGDNFNLPDLRGKTLFGVNADDEKFANVGDIGGESEVTLSTEQMPSHSHYAMKWSLSGTEQANVANVEGYVPVSYGLPTSKTGGDKPHNNMPPYLVCNYIIKVCQGIPEMELRLPTDQTYNPESENAQSGKAVEEALLSIGIKPISELKLEIGALPAPGTYIATNAILIQYAKREVISGMYIEPIESYPQGFKPDDGFKSTCVLISKGSIIVIGSTPAGTGTIATRYIEVYGKITNGWDGIGAQRFYTQYKGTFATTNYSDTTVVNSSTGLSYTLSGKYIVYDQDNAIFTNVSKTDQTFNPESENPQSGVAVAEAIKSISSGNPKSEIKDDILYLLVNETSLKAAVTSDGVLVIR